MNRLIILLLLIAALFAGCAKAPAGKKQVVAQINNYQLTVDDFMQEAKLNLPYMLQNDNSGAIKEQLYNDIVTNELILQQAERMGLDKNRDFMKEVENYWKQALIKRLINIKGAEFLAAAKGENDAQKKENAQALLDLWIKGLKQEAKIHKYDDTLNSINLNTARVNEGGANEE
ncbi:MAG: SurA N-terminal domain-containing protein [Candidatus Omnitrophota bacterium]